jgi:hypothetical protein
LVARDNDWDQQFFILKLISGASSIKLLLLEEFGDRVHNEGL